MIDRCQDPFQADGAVYERDGEHPISFARRTWRFPTAIGDEALLARGEAPAPEMRYYLSGRYQDRYHAEYRLYEAMKSIEGATQAQPEELRLFEEQKCKRHLSLISRGLDLKWLYYQVE